MTTKQTKPASKATKPAKPNPEINANPVTTATDDKEINMNTTADLTASTVSTGNVDPIFAPMIAAAEAQLRVLEAELGDLPIRLEAAKGRVADLEAQLKDARQEAIGLQTQVGNKEVAINTIKAQIQALNRPISTMSRMSRRTEAKGQPGKDALTRNLQIAREAVAMHPDGLITNESVQAAKGCNHNSAGGWLKTWFDAGLLDKIEPGKYRISADYANA